MHRAFTDCVSCALYYSQAVEVNLWVIFTSKASFDDTRPLPPSKMDVKKQLWRELWSNTTYIVDDNGLTGYHVVGHDSLLCLHWTQLASYIPFSKFALALQNLGLAVSSRAGGGVCHDVSGCV